jgi:hypothetical protein
VLYEMTLRTFAHRRGESVSAKGVSLAGGGWLVEDRVASVCSERAMLDETNWPGGEEFPTL